MSEEKKPDPPPPSPAKDAVTFVGPATFTWSSEEPPRKFVVVHSGVRGHGPPKRFEDPIGSGDDMEFALQLTRQAVPHCTPGDTVQIVDRDTKEILKTIRH